MRSRSPSVSTALSTEPEQFPGLVCRLKEPRVVVLLFGSGKLVCTGARRPSDVSLAVEKITKELEGAGLLRRERGRANPAVEPAVPEIPVVYRGSRFSLAGSRPTSDTPPDADGTSRMVVPRFPPCRLPCSLGSLAGHEGPSRWVDRETVQGLGRRVDTRSRHSGYPRPLRTLIYSRRLARVPIMMSRTVILGSE